MTFSRRTFTSTPRDEAFTRRLRVVLCLLTVVFGLLHFWHFQFNIKDVDGISYMDMGDAYFRGEWSTAVNGYWSPLYAWLLGLSLMIVRPTAYWEYPFTQVVNFAIYLFSIGCFDFFLRQCHAYNQLWASTEPENGHLVLPEWALLALGYPLFIWSSLYWQYIWLQSPDTCLAALVYLAAGLLLLIRLGISGFAVFVGLATVLGVAYLTKAVMFLLSLVFLLIAFLAAPRTIKLVPRALAALVVFAIISAPLIGAISLSKGRLTFGDAGRINYAWYVNGVVSTWPHWHGEPPGFGTPVHPSRRILEEPTVYEFGSLIGGTYPMWYDPSYWHEGIQPQLNLAQQMERLKKSVKWYAKFFILSPQLALAASLLVLSLAGIREHGRIRAYARYWLLFVPTLSALGLYALVNLEARYIAPFVVMLWLGSFSGVRLAKNKRGRTILASTVASAAMVLTMAAVISTVVTLRDDTPPAHSSVVNWKVAKGLELMGIKPGDKVGVIGSGLWAARWARLARVRIVAELPLRQAEPFWSPEATAASRIIEAFKRAGVDVIVSDRKPHRRQASKWREIGDTGYFAHQP